ncbi:MAG: 5'-nucleotidase C-terminal domain-containing protein, partial [Oscillospiraceae bacterium]
MKNRSKLMSLLLAVVMTLSLTVTGFAADTTTAVAKGDVVVLYTNDVHCAADATVDKEGKATGMGYAGVAGYRADMLKLTDYVTLVDAGDALQGDVLGTLSKGQFPVDVMNAVGYDVAVPGNHEFDYGMAQFMTLAKALKSGYTCCNFVDLRTGKPVFDAYQMITYGDTKVAFVGIDTPEAFSKASPATFKDATGKTVYGFCEGNNGKDLYASVQTAVDAAKKDGAKYVIAVGHCGIDAQSSPWTSKEIIANVSGLSAFIDGHSHDTIPSENVKDKDSKTVILTSTGTKLAALGKLVLKADGTITTSLVTDYTGKDVKVDAFVKEVYAKNEALLNKVVAKSNVDLTILGADGKRAVRSAETNLGDLCADAYREIGGADIAWLNGGGVRDSIAKGDITYGQIIKVNPFGNKLCVVKATGQEILNALEMASRNCPEENGGFLQVSGLTYTINTTTPSTVKVDDKGAFVAVEGAYRVSDVMVGGKALDLKKTYTVASHNFMLKEGGDGINMFMDNQVLQDEIMLDNQVLITYITENLKGIVPDTYAKAQGRITIKAEAAATPLPFTDVPTDAWYLAGVQYAVEHNLFAGITATTFAPKATMTRGQLVTVLWRMAGKPAAKAPAAFTDVAADSYCADAVSWAVENKIAGGYTATTFAPDRPITREQLATILYGYAKFDGTAPTGAWAIKLTYTDLDKISDWAVEPAMFCQLKSIITGQDGKFNPAGKASRAEVAVIMQRFCEATAKPAE